MARQTPWNWTAVTKMTWNWTELVVIETTWNNVGSAEITNQESLNK